MNQREALFLRANRIFHGVYYVLGAAMVLVYAVRADSYHLAVSAGTLAVPFLLQFFHRILRLKPSQQMNFLILAFVFLSYPLGCCLDFYRQFLGFDKLAHMLSGVFVSILCITLYGYLKPGHKFEQADLALAIVFTFFGSMAVAGLWELCEYALSSIAGLDVQRVKATGIKDTMNDMLVCLVGTIATLPIVHRLSRGKHGPFSSPIQSFIDINT